LTDIFSKEKRSWVMSRIRSKDTKIEKLMEQKLNEHEIRFKKHYKIFGTPDFVIEDKKIAIFLDGEFWHGHKKGKVKLRKLPEYWQKKIAYNKKRMQTVNQKLKKEGWIVLRFWERDVKKNLDSCIKTLLQKLRE
jgi:DNA mismatch endonuclease (patch repair protein)